MKRFITVFILFFVGIWFLKIWYLGELGFYILPRFNVLVVASGLIFLVFGVALLFFGRDWHEIHYHLDSKSFFSFSLLLCAVFLFPPRPLSSQSVSQRGVETDLRSIQLTTPINFEIDSTQRTFADWIKIISTSENTRQYAGERLRITGFVFKDETLTNPDEFYLARFLIRCCSADARPVVLRVKSKESFDFQNDQWLDIQGVFAIDENIDQPLFIDLISYELTSMPQTPYIY